MATITIQQATTQSRVVGAARRRAPMVLIALLLAGGAPSSPAAGAAGLDDFGALIEGIPLALNLEYGCGRIGRERPSHGGALWMAAEVTESQLQRRWVHSHEDDTGDHLVFRSPGLNLPPSRGRTVLSLAAEGTVQVDAPGADDRGAASAGRWTLQGNRLTITAPGFSGAFDIESVDEDRLVLRRAP